VPRRGSDSYKWDSDTDASVLPMWVADMDFATTPAVVAALEARVRHGIFGYAKVPEAYHQATIDWFSKRHGLVLDAKWILPVTGVVPALSAVIRALTNPGDGVIIQPPVYNCFYSSIRNMQCNIIESPLRLEGGRYAIDFDDLERCTAQSAVKVLLLCNPHNPVGRAWSRDELKRVGEICFKQGVTVVSDEIHCDLVMPGQRHIPFASLGETFAQHSVTCISPSKAFNLAGLHVANIVAADSQVRQHIDRALNIHEVGEIGPLAITALIAAYQGGAQWLDDLCEYIQANYLHLQGRLAHSRITLLPMEATYLAWIDCRKLGMSSQILAEKLADSHLRVSPGTLYGKAGEGFIRLNLACPRAILDEGINRLLHAMIKL